jgi:hypothetical protein
MQRGTIRAFPAGHKSALRAVLLTAAAAASLACSDRARITFPSDDGIGPTTTIIRPVEDTSATAGAFVLVDGRSVDADGIDSVFFATEGTPEQFPTFIVPASERRDTLNWSIPVSTRLLGGNVISIFVTAADRLGNVGEAAVRRIQVQP